MRNLTLFFCLCAMLLLCTACGDSQASTQAPSAGNSVSDVLEQGKAEADNATPETPELPATDAPTPTAPQTSSDSAIDVDLTTLNANMVYAEVYQMMSAPEDYIGKIVKMTGAMRVISSPEENITYYAVIIQDATACCAQGIEFVLADESQYPTDGAQVTIVGRYETYMEQGDLYAHLVDSVWIA